MIRLRNQSEQILELATGSAALTAVNNIAQALVFGDFEVKAVMGRLASAPVTGNTVLNVVRNRAGVKTTICTLTFASGSFVPTYSAVAAAPFLLAKGDIIEVDCTGVATTAGTGLVVDVSISRQYDNYPGDGLVQTDSVLGVDAEPLF